MAGRDAVEEDDCCMELADRTAAMPDAGGDIRDQCTKLESGARYSDGRQLGSWAQVRTRIGKKRIATLGCRNL